MEKVKKITKKERFAQLKAIEAVAQNEELIAFIDHEIELLERKNANSNGEKKLTPVQIANNGIKDDILAYMEKYPDQIFTITELIKKVPNCADLSNQRVSALVRQLVLDEKIEKIIDKRKSFFKINL